MRTRTFFSLTAQEELASSGLGAINSDHLLAASSFAAFGALDLVPQSVDSVLTGLLDDDGSGSLSGAFGSGSIGGSLSSSSSSSSSGMFGSASAMPSFTSSMWGSPDPAAASSSLFANAGAASQPQYSSAAPDSASAYDSSASEADALLSDPQLLAAVAAAAASGSDVVLPDGTTLPADAVLQLLSALAAGTLGGSGSGDYSGAHSAGDSGVESGATAVSMDELEKKLAAAHLADGSSQSQMATQQQQQQQQQQDSAASSSGLQPATSEAPSQQHQYQPRLRIPLPRTARFALMGTHDLEFVLRSQLMQLSSKNPMNDDFYFQVMNARKGGRYRGSGFPLAAATNRVNPFRNADGTPSYALLVLLLLLLLPWPLPGAWFFRRVSVSGLGNVFLLDFSSPCLLCLNILIFFLLDLLPTPPLSSPSLNRIRAAREHTRSSACLFGAPSEIRARSRQCAAVGRG
jgi:hypothetical protein